MALGYGTAYGSWATGSGNPVTFNFTCGATAKSLILVILNATTTARTGGTPTYNSINMTQLGTQQAGSAECNVEMWRLHGPPTGSSYQISIPNSGSLTLYATCFTLTSGDAVGDFGTVQQTGTSSATPQLTINSVPAGGATVSVLGHGYKDAPTARSHTVILETDQGAWSSNSQYGLHASSGNVTHSWTVGGSDDVAMIMAAFEQVSAPVVVVPAAASAKGTGVDPTVVLGSISITPANGQAVDPTVIQGSITISPALAAAIAAALDPTVIYGSLVVIPDPAAAKLYGIDPVVQISSGETVTPAAAAAIAAAVDPAVVNNVLLSPAVAAALASGVDPSVVFGSLMVTPAPAEARALVPNPVVIGGEPETGLLPYNYLYTFSY